MKTDQTTNAAPEAVCSTAMLGPPPERDARWALAELFGVSRQAVEAWGERLPELRAYQLRQLRPGWFRRKT